MRKRLNDAMKDAMRAKDAPRLSTVRLINAAVKDRDIAARSEDNPDGVADSEILSILAKMIKQREESARTYEEAGRIELGDRERAEIKVIQEFLPKQLTASEVEDAVKAAIFEVGATSIRDMGKVMGILKSRYNGQMDFGKIGGQIKGMLG